MEQNIINSLKRLERVGAENSRVTEKLKISCNEVAKIIVGVLEKYCEDTTNEKEVWRYVNLPLGYQIVKIEMEDCNRWTLITPRQDFLYDHPYNRSLAFVPNDITRDDALIFAKDISEGLLEEISDFIENETKAAIDAEKEIDQAIYQYIETKKR